MSVRVQALFYESTLLRMTPLKIRSPHGQDQGIREQIALMLQKSSIIEVPQTLWYYTSVCFWCAKRPEGGYRSEISHVEAPHFCMFSVSSVPVL